MSEAVGMTVLDYTTGNVQETLDYLREVERRLGTMLLPHPDSDAAFEDLYVPVRVWTQRKSTLDPYEAAEEENRQYRGEWIGEQERGIRRLFRQDNPDGATERGGLPQEWARLREGIKQVVILGHPGMGKSTLLRAEGRRRAREEAEKLETGHMGSSSVVLPIFIPLKALAEEEG